jgi:hypothetical protein
LEWRNSTDGATGKSYVEIPDVGAPTMNVFSAFALTGGIAAYLDMNKSDVTTPDMYNNWWPGIDANVINITKVR